MKKCTLIINPKSGKKTIYSSVLPLMNCFCQADYELTVAITQCPLHATKLVTHYCRQSDIVVCCGGDGTLNEVVSGMMQCSHSVPIGYIPCGTTNDFAHSLAIPTQPLKAAKMILENQGRLFDVGKFNQNYFTYIASFGLFTGASYSTNQQAKNILGHAAYLLSGLRELTNIRAYPMKIETEDSVIEDEFIFGAISNSTSIAGILKLDEAKVRFDDGFFEVLLIKMPKNLVELNEMILALSTKTYNPKHILFFPSKKLKIETQEKVPWTLDGEYHKPIKKVDITCIHQAVEIITAPSQNK